MRAFSSIIAALTLLLSGAAAAPAAAQSGGYSLAHRYTLGGDGGWDYLTLDPSGGRLFIGRQRRIMVVDPDRGTVLAEIPGFQRAHGVALDPSTEHGFATSGGDSTVVMFDLKTLEVLKRTTAAVDCDAILYDPASKRVFTLNGDAHSASVIDPETGERIGTVPLGAKPEFGVSDGGGHVYANLESTSEVAEIDAGAMKVTRRWSIEPCESPSGLAIDVTHHRIFSVCHSQVMGISDTEAGRLVATVPIGANVDAARFDPGTQLAFASNGDGTLTVVHEDSPDRYRVVQTIRTMEGARTMELNPSDHRLYTVSAKFAPPSFPGSRRRSVVPGSFTLLEYSR